MSTFLKLSENLLIKMQLKWFLGWCWSIGMSVHVFAEFLNQLDQKGVDTFLETVFQHFKKLSFQEKNG